MVQWKRYSKSSEEVRHEIYSTAQNRHYGLGKNNKEVDENLDMKIDEREFELMYKKCIEDKTFLEPKTLFNLVQYLMFCRCVENHEGIVTDPTDFHPIIIPEDTYFLIYGRLDRQFDCDKEKRDRLDDEIRIIFEDEKNTDGSDKEINYQIYLEQVNDYALKIRKELRDSIKFSKVIDETIVNKLKN